MVRLATKGNRHFMVSDVEIRRAGRSYTIDTVRHFLNTLRAPSTLFLMMGSDAFAELDTWKDCDELVRLSSIAVHTRPRTATASRREFRLPLSIALATLGKTIITCIPADRHFHS